MKPKPTSAAERLAELATEAKSEGLDDVSHIIYQVKAGEEPEENLKALVRFKAKKEVWAATYAFLLNCEKKDEEVSMLNLDGLRLMILHRLRTLMPKECGKCLKNHTQDRQDRPKVICLRCDHPACPECFSEPVDLNTWVYVCQPCQKVVKDDLGVGRLEDKHFMKSKKKKKEVITLAENEDEEELEEDEGDEDEEEKEEEEGGEDKQPESESEETEGIETAFLPAGWKKRGFKKDARKPGSGEKMDEKKKICIHHRKGRCKFGLSGKKRIDGEWKKCPFEHPRVCEKLLNNGDRGKFGCKGDCKKLHPKMCFSSLNSKKCPYDRDCRNGYHVRGTVKVEKGRAQGPQRQLKPSGGAQGPQNQNENLNFEGRTAPPQAGPAGRSGSSPFFDLGQKVREEILQVLRELKLTAPAPPPPPKKVSREDLMEALKELMK